MERLETVGVSREFIDIEVKKKYRIGIAHGSIFSHYAEVFIDSMEQSSPWTRSYFAIYEDNRAGYLWQTLFNTGQSRICSAEIL